MVIFDNLNKVMRDDQELADSWHDNLAMSFLDSVPQVVLSEIQFDRMREICNAGAARFMKMAFNVVTVIPEERKRQELPEDAGEKA